MKWIAIALGAGLLYLLTIPVSLMVVALVRWGCGLIFGLS